MEPRSRVRVTPHGLGQVRRSDEKHVDVIHFQNFIQVLQRLGFLQQNDDHGLLVSLVEIVGYAIRLASAEHSTVAEGRVFGRLHRLLGVAAAVHVGSYYAHRATVQGSSNEPGLV